MKQLFIMMMLFVALPYIEAIPKQPENLTLATPKIRFFKLFGYMSSQTKQEQIREIDAQIQELEEMKRGYEARAIRAEDQANRLQFEDHFVLETRRYFQIAQLNREKAAKIQSEIDRLKIKRTKLKK